MKTIKQLLEEKDISQEKFDAMSAEEKAELYNELTEANKVAFEKMQNDLEDGESKVAVLAEAMKVMEENQAESIKTIFKAMNAQGIAVTKLLKAGGASLVSEMDSVKSQLVENKDAIKSLASGSGDDIQIKALTNVASIALNTWGFNLPDVGQLGTRQINMTDLFPTFTIAGDNINKRIVYWDWDEDTTVRAAAPVAEGAAFPESEAKWKQYTVDIRKIGDTLPVTEEFMEDESMFASELEMFLAINMALEIDDQILNGDGTGENLDGLNNGAPAFVAVASGIVDASIYDLIVKVSEDITTLRGAKYRPDFAVMNIADINLMKLKKDANNNYILPPFVSRDGMEVAGIMIVENNGQAVNTLVMGDRRFARIYQAAGFTLSRGTVGAQFTADMMTLKVRQRMAFLMREVDKTGFRSVASISADLVTLATP